MAVDPQRLKAEITRIEEHIASLERDRTRVPWLLGTAILAIPAGVVWGVEGVLFALFASISLAMVAAYLIEVRRREYQTELRDVHRMLERTRDEAV